MLSVHAAACWVKVCQSPCLQPACCLINRCVPWACNYFLLVSTDMILIAIYVYWYFDVSKFSASPFVLYCMYWLHLMPDI